MACPDENRLVEFVEGLLPADVQRELDQHVDDCIPCRMLLAHFAHGSVETPAEVEELDAGRAVADRYTILDILGTGAMSVVYAAYDRILDRKVALKVLRDADPSQAGRLQREAQAMARLAHPNVVPVYDVGTVDGRMFLTAELVVGRTVAKWIADEPDRSWQDVVDVFVQAGRGLAAAHAAGITHRDFKPSNVLIGEDGRVRVADFGLAGHVAAEVVPGIQPAGDPASTRTGQLVGTPAYMAPEQLAGGAADARSDQYAFCASLFEALHGQRPFVAASLSGLLAAIEAGKQVPVGRRVPAGIERVLDRGLAADPDRRAPSLDDAVGELERALARPRRRATLAMLGTIVALGTALAIAHGRQGDPCRGAGDGLAGSWDAPHREALRATFVAGLPSGGQVFDRVAATLDGYGQRWSAMRVEACEATEVRHTQSAALLDLRMTCLDRRRTELATLVGALTDKPDRERISRGAEAALQLSSLASCADGTALVARVAPPEDPVTRVRVDAVESRLASATGLERAGDYKAALAVTQGAAVEAGALGYEPLIADALFRRGRLEGSTGDQKAAEASFGEALRRAAIAHDDRLTAAAWIGLVEVVGFRLARRDEGLTFARAAETSLLRLGGDPLLEAELHEQRGQILRELASYDAAVAEHRHALELRRAALPAGDPRIAQSLHALAEVERIQGKLDVARGDHEAALAARIAALGPDHPLVAISLMNLGHCFFALGQVAEARAHYERALAIDQRALPPDHPEIGNALTSLGAVEETEGKLDAAIARYTEAAAIYRASLGDRSPMLAIVETDLAQAERARKQFPAAQAHFERALAIHLALGKHDHPAVAEVLSSYAEMLYYDLHREADARARYEEASAIFDKIPGVNPALASGPIVGLADLALDAKDPRRAAELLERALAMRAQDSPAQIAWVKYRLAEALWLARPAERVRAHALATEARAAFAADPVNRPALDTWLAAHSL